MVSTRDNKWFRPFLFPFSRTLLLLLAGDKLKLLESELLIAPNDQHHDCFLK